MRLSKFLNLTVCWLVVVFFVLGIPVAQAESSVVKWERIVGVIVPGTMVGGVSSVAFPWTATRGRAMVNLKNDQMKFDVQGLVLSGSPPAPGAVIGTSGVVNMMKGTLVCNPLAGPVLVDSPPVPLNTQGDGNFQGTVITPIPAVCDNPAFLIRVSNPPQIANLWIAHGAVRTP